MDHLLECAEAFEQLLDVQYHIVLGRKNRLTELTLRFDPTEFHHLVGLHKLRDLRLARGNREKIFYQILSKTICMEDIKKSRYFPEIQDRMFFFDKIEYLLDSNKTVFLQVLFPKRREGLHKRTSSLYIIFTQSQKTGQKNQLKQHEEKLAHLKGNMGKFSSIPPEDENDFADYLVLHGAVLREETNCKWLKDCIKLCKK